MFYSSGKIDLFTLTKIKNNYDYQLATPTDRHEKPSLKPSQRRGKA